MSNSKLFRSLSDQNNKVNKNAFDLSRRAVFSMHAGDFIPCFKQATLPSGEYSVDVRQKLRTNPVIGAPFTRMELNYEFSYVDNQHSYSGFNEFIAQREDDQTAVVMDSKHVPFLEGLQGLQACLLFMAAHDTLIDKYCPNGKSYAADNDDFSYVLYPVNAPWTSCGLSAVRMLDLLGYGNLVPFVNLLVKSVENDDTHDEYIQGFPSVTTESNMYSFFSDQKSLCWHLLSELKRILQLIPFMRTATAPVSVNLWPILAYNRIWSSQKRNVIYDNTYLVKNVSPDSYECRYSKLFNVDDLVSVSGGTPHVASFDCTDFISYFMNVDLTTSTFAKTPYSVFQDLQDEMPSGEQLLYRLLSMLTIKPVPYHKDLFSGVLPSTQFGDVSVMTNNTDWFALFYKDDSLAASNEAVIARDKSTTNRSFFPIGSDGSAFTNTDVNKYTNARFRMSPAAAISVLEMRRADAMQRFSERMLRAGNKTDDNFRAHWGVVPRSYKDYEPTFLGAFDGGIDLNTVASTTETSSLELGQLGSNGIATVSGSKVKFNSSGFGYIIGCCYLTKPAEYEAYGIDRDLQLLDVWDFPYPELMNISLAPVDVYTLNPFPALAERVLGYLPRFIEHKTSVDKVHGEFYSNAPIDLIWNAGDDAAAVNGGSFASMVTPRVEYGSNLSAIDFLYVQPSSLDNIFAVAANNIQKTDNFFVNCQFDVYAYQPLSVLGLPY